MTTRELRQVYDVDSIRLLLQITMIVAFATGVFNVVRTHGQRWMGAVGVACTLAAYLMGGWRVPVGPVDQLGPGLGVDWMLLDLLGSTLIFIFIEKLAPKYDQPILRPEWDLDLAYFALNHLAIGMLFIFANGFAPSAFKWAVNDHVQGFVSGLWYPLQVLFLMFCADLVQYWMHRAYHEVPWLWRLHAVHHSAEHMDWLAGSRTHLVQTILDRMLVMVPLYLLGPTEAALNAYVTVISFQAVMSHSNVRIPFGPLKYVFVSPQLHHWHHSKDKPAIDTNYAAHLPVLDMMFGSYHMPDEHWPKEYGTTQRLSRTMLAQFKYPFTRRE